MPSCGEPRYRKYYPDWKTMGRDARKMFHRDNESRARRGLKPLAKPKAKEPEYYDID